ncbi:MAG: hypothetical protein CL946_08820 [Ectothiorhodospiraceae bacterium]|nr:hypothetical protein [Ectothiorhodospiraceae bacterium]
MERAVTFQTYVRSLFQPVTYRSLTRFFLLVSILTIIFSTSITQATAVLAALVAIIGSFASRTNRFRMSPALYPILAFAAARLLAIIFSEHIDLSVHALRMEIFFYSVAVMIFNEFDELDVLFVVRFLFIAGVLAALYGIFGYTTGMHNRAMSTTAGYYTLGMFLCAVLPVSIPFGERKDVFPRAWLWYAGTAVMLFGLLLTFNRLHWVAAGAALTIGALLFNRKLLIPIGIGAAAALIFFPEIIDRFVTLFNVGEHMSDRDVLWKGASMLVGDHPVLGFGLRTFPAIFPLMHEVADKGVGSWHNDFLQVYMESGLLGILAYLGSFGGFIYYGIRTVKLLPPDSQYRSIAAGIALSSISFLIGGFIIDPHILMLFLTLYGALAVLHRYAASHNVQKEPGKTPA